MVSQRTAICMLPPEVWTCNALAAEVNGIGVWRSHSRCRHIVPNPRQSAGALVNVTIELQSSHCLRDASQRPDPGMPAPKDQAHPCGARLSRTREPYAQSLPSFDQPQIPAPLPTRSLHCNEPFHMGSNASSRDYGGLALCHSLGMLSEPESTHNFF